ncbi:MAG: DUF5615 family PIN-like protein [Tepidisphaeraceae bacterium]
MKFLADMGVSAGVVQWLRREGHDAVHLRELGLPRLEDHCGHGGRPPADSASPAGLKRRSRHGRNRHRNDGFAFLDPFDAGADGG